METKVRKLKGNFLLMGKKKGQAPKISSTPGQSRGFKLAANLKSEYASGFLQNSQAQACCSNSLCKCPALRLYIS